MHKVIPLLSLLIIVAACNRDKTFEKNNIYKKYYKMEDNGWNRVDGTLVFDVKIDDTASLYNMDIEIRHADFYPFPYLDIGFSVLYPDGDSRVSTPRIYVKDSEGKFKGKGAGDIWDYSSTIRENYSFPEKGNYRIEIDNYTGNHYVLPGIMEIGLVIRKVK